MGNQQHSHLEKARVSGVAAKAAVLTCVVCGKALAGLRVRLCGSAGCKRAHAARYHRARRRRLARDRRRAQDRALADRADRAAALAAADHEIEARRLWAQHLLERELDTPESDR